MKIQYCLYPVQQQSAYDSGRRRGSPQYWPGSRERGRCTGTWGDRILPSWHTARGKQSFTFRIVKQLNNLPKSILNVKGKILKGKAIKQYIATTVSPYSGKYPEYKKVS